MARFVMVRNPNGQKSVVNLEHVVRAEVHQILPTQWQVRLHFTEGNPSEYGNYESEHLAYAWVNTVFQPEDPEHHLDPYR